MAKPIDISVPLHPEMVVWPDSVGFSIRRAQSIAAGGAANVSTLEMDVHTGTHVEASLHFNDDGEPLDAIALDAFVGPAHVVYLPGADAIGAVELASVPVGVERLLLRTRNSEGWSRHRSFARDFVALTAQGAHWIAERKMRLVGIDGLSVQRWGDDPETHRILMRAGVVILEGLDLSEVDPGLYRLTCLPLSLVGAEASPVRAILEIVP